MRIGIKLTETQQGIIEKALLEKAVGRHPLEEAAISHFGVTKNPHEAGYVLRDGTMLDFSGRHAGYPEDQVKGDRL